MRALLAEAELKLYNVKMAERVTVVDELWINIFRFVPRFLRSGRLTGTCKAHCCYMQYYNQLLALMPNLEPNPNPNPNPNPTRRDGNA